MQPYYIHPGLLLNAISVEEKTALSGVIFLQNEFNKKVTWKTELKQNISKFCALRVIIECLRKWYFISVNVCNFFADAWTPNEERYAPRCLSLNQENGNGRQSQMNMNNCLGCGTAKSLFDTDYYFNWKIFGLRWSEHRNLSLKNFELRPNFIKFEEHLWKRLFGGCPKEYQAYFSPYRTGARSLFVRIISNVHWSRRE